MGKFKFYVTTVVTLLSLSFHADTISASSNAVLSQEGSLYLGNSGIITITKGFNCEKGGTLIITPQ